MSHQFKKSLGQNFLRADRFAAAMVSSLGEIAGKVVFEIGPGDGRVTNLLLQRGAIVVAIEKDYDLVPKLIQRFGSNPNFYIEHMDIMDIEPLGLLGKIGTKGDEYFLAGSLPYNISKLIIRKFLESDSPPQKFSCIVQLEVGQDYVASAPRATFLSNWVQLFADVKKLQTIPASQFFPKPKVDGAILVFTPKANRVAEIADLLNLGFAAPRKTLRNNLLATGRWSTEEIDSTFEKIGLNQTVRPAELTPESWRNLRENLK